MKYSAIILAAGSGKRTGLEYNKIFVEINAKKVINYSIDFFKKYSIIDEIILVVNESDYLYFVEHYKNLVDKIVVGGSERQESVYKALNQAESEFVIIHDGARPFIPSKAIDEIFEQLPGKKAITLAVPVKDTIQKVDGNRAVKTLNRSELFAVQTPQAFEKRLLMSAHTKALENHFSGTDDTMLVQKMLGVDTYVVQGDYRNMKLTTKEDILFLEAIL